MRWLFLVGMLFYVGNAGAETYESARQSLHSGVFVAVDGDDGAAGTHSQPVKTLTRAVEAAAPGEVIYLKGGAYSSPMSVEDVHGSAEQPLVIRSAPGERVVFDGTDVLPDNWQEVTRDSKLGEMIQHAQWKVIGGNKVFSQKLDKPIYALIYEDRLMSDARWPNARWDDPWRLDRYNVLRRATEASTPGELHDGFPTRNTLEESSKWVHYDREEREPYRQMLAETGVDFTGSVVLMSYAWGSWGTRVLEHEAGSNSFRFDATFEGSGSLQDEAVRFIVNRVHWDDENRFKRSSHGGIHYFFLGMPALDTPEEWWYDEGTKTLFFISPDGKKPAAGQARGKRRDYLLEVEDSSHVHLKGFDFLGAAARIENSQNSRLEDCNFRFSSYHKFVVGDFDMPRTTRIANKRGKDGRVHGNALVNCQFSYLDGNAFEGRSMGLIIDNVRVFRTQQTTLGLDSRSISIDDPSLVRRVSIGDVGASVGIKGGKLGGMYILNDICCFGGLQYDGAALQMGGREKYRYLFNWSHDHPKRSYRFDAATNPSYSNAYGEIAYNIAWNTPGGMAIKGDDHLIHNNLMMGDSKIELFNMERWASHNERTVVANNVVARFEAGADDRSGIKPPPRAKVLSIMHNNMNEDATEYLRDPANLDFRPRKDSPLVDAGYRLTSEDVPWKDSAYVGMDSYVGVAPDIGAYEYGAEAYWIPGFQHPHASRPVPPDGSGTVKPDADLMWLGGYQAGQHHVYFGREARKVSAAGMASPEYKGTFEGIRNIYTPDSLEAGRTYYWRVDAVRNGIIVKGETWSFTVEGGKPNILFIMSDDHTTQAIGAYGGRLASLDPTPTIDRLAEEGTRFDNVFVTNSICTPSRASIITGQYSQNNGVLDLNGSIGVERQHLPKLMSEAGYETAMIGKWHLKKEPLAFDYYKVLPGQGKYFDPTFRDIDADGEWPKNTVQHEGHSSDVITDLAIQWLSNRDGDKPFFLMHHYKAPHDMFENAPRYDDYLSEVTIPEPANLFEQPGWGSKATRGENDSLRAEIGTSISKRNPRRNMGIHMGVDPDLSDKAYTQESYQRYLKRYLRTVKGVDDNLERLFDYLKQSGQWDNTVIIYTGDQGMMLGEHDLIDKRWMWEESLRMPFIVRHPHKLKAPKSSELIVNNTDFAPLMLDFAGAGAPDFMQGKSFATIMDGVTPDDWRTASYYRYWMHRAHHDVPAHFGLRNSRYKLIFFYGAHYDATPVQSDVVYAGKNWSRKDGVIPSKTPTPAGWEFYDLEKDPSEVNNHYGDPKYVEIILSMKQELLRQREVYGETDRAYPHLEEIIDEHWDD